MALVYTSSAAFPSPQKAHFSALSPFFFNFFPLFDLHGTLTSAFIIDCHGVKEKFVTHLLLAHHHPIVSRMLIVGINCFVYGNYTERFT